MRNLVSLTCLLLLLSIALPAQAQMRETALEQRAPAKLYDTNSSGFALNKMFDPAHFRMSQSIEFGASSFGGQTSSLGMFTNSMMWQFNESMAARVDVSVAYSPNATNLNALSTGQSGSPQVFIRNAEFAYKPSDKVQLHLSFRQSPYGGYGSPYGQYGYGRSPYGYGARSSMFQASFGSADNLFWRNEGR